MNNPTHTPGPWHVNDEIRDKLYIESHKEFIADVQLEECSGIGEAMRVRANATLIAAAPELYRLLKDAREAWLNNQDDDLAGILGGDICTDALDMAEGRTR